MVPFFADHFFFCGEHLVISYKFAHRESGSENWNFGEKAALLIPPTVVCDSGGTREFRPFSRRERICNDKTIQSRTS